MSARLDLIRLPDRYLAPASDSDLVVFYQSETIRGEGRESVLRIEVTAWSSPALGLTVISVFTGRKDHELSDEFAAVENTHYVTTRASGALVQRESIRLYDDARWALVCNEEPDAGLRDDAARIESDAMREGSPHK